MVSTLHLQHDHDMTWHGDDVINAAIHTFDVVSSKARCGQTAGRVPTLPQTGHQAPHEAPLRRCLREGSFVMSRQDYVSTCSWS